jgi:hypothetical protein
MVWPDSWILLAAGLSMAESYRCGRWTTKNWMPPEAYYLTSHGMWTYSGGRAHPYSSYTFLSYTDCTTVEKVNVHPKAIVDMSWPTRARKMPSPGAIATRALEMEASHAQRADCPRKTPQHPFFSVHLGSHVQKAHILHRFLTTEYWHSASNLIVFVCPTVAFDIPLISLTFLRKVWVSMDILVDVSAWVYMNMSLQSLRLFRLRPRGDSEWFWDS